MRTRATVTVSIPPEMIDAVEKVRKAEHHTRSELVREALRTYFMLAGRAYTPTRAEQRAIEQGRAAIGRGNYFTLKEFRAYVGGESKKARAKKRLTRASTTTTYRRR
ncbi:MAG: ribbon-helix-helix protein, CopG family [Candidatus Rokubacteria bacterium]|nr:ribbon-helix-helix protein, CopG family [Candidatus Rokubacteria bacterium]